MVKKTAAFAKATASLKTQKKNNKQSKQNENTLGIPSALRYFWDFADLVWQYASANRALLAAERPSLTAAYITDQVAYVAVTKALPANDVRTAQKTKKRVSLSKERKKVMVQANLLEDAITLAYEDQPDLIPIEIKEAGITTLRTASERDWSAVSTFLTTCGEYLTTSGGKLVDAGAISPTFAANFTTVSTDFNAAKTAFNDQKQASKDGTSAVAKGVKKIRKAIGSVLKLGKTVFESDPDKLKLFTGEYLLAQVRSTHPASLDGRTEWAETGQRIEGILVEVLDVEDRSAVTNKDGRYIIKQLAAGEHIVRFSGTLDTGEEILPIERTVVLEPGKARRLNVKMEPAPVPQPAEETLNDMLKDSLIAVSASQNGTPHPENGVAIS